MRPEGEVTVSSRVRAHVALTKPRIVELLLATALPTTTENITEDIAEDVAKTALSATAHAR